jgi:Domain of unknown function (DUF4145)
MNNYYPPVFEKNDFHCPHCGVYAKQNWTSAMTYGGVGYLPINNLKVSTCTYCDDDCVWYSGNMLYPDNHTAPKPHTDLPEELLGDYLEAASILSKSPRGASALLRLVLQKLMKVLGEPGRDINSDIASLVKKGLPPEVQQALDIVRVIGNESVHPGQINLNDDSNTAVQLFELINFIVEDRISRPQRINTLFQKLPEGKRKGIEQRDKVKTPK